MTHSPGRHRLLAARGRHRATTTRLASLIAPALGWVAIR